MGLADYLSEKITDKLFEGHHAKASELVRTVLHFRAPAPADHLFGAILARLNLPTQPSKLLGKPYLASVSGTQAIILIGSTMGTGARLALATWTDEHGTVGEARVLNFTKQGEQIVGTPWIEQFLGATNEVVMAFGGQVWPEVLPYEPNFT